MNRTGITSRVTIVIILVAVLSAGLTGLSAYLISKQQFNIYINQGTASLGERMAAEVESYYLSKGSLTGLQYKMESLSYFRMAHKPPIGGGQHRPYWADDVIITDPNGTVYASSSYETLGMHVIVSEKEYNAYPVLAENEEVAVVYLFNPLRQGVMSMENQFLDSIASQTTNAMLITITLALIIGILLARRITRPISDLSTAIHNLARGNLDTRVQLAGDREFIQLSEDFNYMAQKLWEHEQSRNSLVANIAHELRTPLSILRGQLEAVQTGSMQLTEDMKSSLVDEIIRLTRLVKELETVGLAESGALRLNIESIKLSEVLERLLPLRLAMEDEGIEFQVDIPEPEACIKADINRLTQILINLFSNAMKHTPAQGGVIKLSIDQGENETQFSVKDNGCGIKEEDLPYIFDRFYRTDEARTREEGGSGLGLAIARSYVRAHGGSIWAESEEGKGSQLYFTLPNM